MRVFLVGGAIRDRLLGLPVSERDWVVVGATEQAMLERGFAPVDAEFPVFRHPQTGDEYSLARTERKTGEGYRGFAVYAGPDVTLEQDLIRRDLTINALAEDENGNLIDLFQGCEDLDAGMLRHISPAFVEDPVRLLRIARFAARLGQFGFRVAHATHGLLKAMARSPDLASVRPERMWYEMSRALHEAQPHRFFEVLHRCGALAVLNPELAGEMQVPGTHQADANDSRPIADLKRAALLSDDPVVRFAAVMRLAAQGIADGDQLCRRLRAGREYAELLRLLVSHGAAFAGLPSDDPVPMLELVHATRALQRRSRFKRFLSACRACWPHRGEERARLLERALAAAASVSAQGLVDEGFAGAELGKELNRRRLAAIRDGLGTG